MHSPIVYPEGNELSGCGQSTQGLRKTTAPTETGFLEFSLEDWVTCNPLRNGSVILSSSGPFAAGTCIWLQPHLLRDFDVRVTGFRAQLCCLLSAVMLDKLFNLSEPWQKWVQGLPVRINEMQARFEQSLREMLHGINDNQQEPSTSHLNLPASLTLVFESLNFDLCG